MHSNEDTGSEIITSTSNLCEVCKSCDFKYKCPKCFTKTCCLECAKTHKKMKMKCNPPPKDVRFLDYISMQDYGNENFQKDLNFLEEIEWKLQNRISRDQFVSRIKKLAKPKKQTAHSRKLSKDKVEKHLTEKKNYLCN